MTNETAVFLQLYTIITKSRAGYADGLLFGKEYNSLWADHLTERAKNLIESYYERICEVEGKKELTYWGEKHPHHCECFEFLSSLYPQARYIYIIRDPKDTACSISEMLNVDYRTGLGMWRDVTDKYEAFIRNVEPTSLLCIRFEDFVADYELMAKSVFKWLGLDYSPEVEEFLRAYGSVDAHDLWMPKHTYTDFKAKSVGRWRRELSESDRLYTEGIAGDFMQRYRYPLESGGRAVSKV